MIRWARRGERHCWSEHWGRQWPTTDGRSRIVVNAGSPHELSTRLRNLPNVRPGARLVLTCRTDPMADDGWPTDVGLGSWTPERPHCSEPWPGDPVVTRAWLTSERIDVDQAETACVAAVLSRRVLPHELDDLVLMRGFIASGHFPLPPGAAVPMPDRLRGRSRFTAVEMAEALGSATPDVAPLLDEMLAASALRAV